MVIEVELPDGNIAEFPDDMAEADIAKALAGYSAPEKPSPIAVADDEESIWDDAKRVAGRTARTLASGVGMAADLPAMAVKAVADPLHYYGQKGVEALTGYDFGPWQSRFEMPSDAARSSFDALTGQKYAPRDDWERLGDKGGEFLTSMAAFGPLAKVAGLADDAARYAPNTVENIVQKFTPRTASDLTAAAGAGIGGESARQSGENELLGNIAGGALGLLAGKPLAGTLDFIAAPKQTTREAAQSLASKGVSTLLNTGQGRITGMPGIKYSLDDDFAKAGRKLEEDLDIDLTLGELTGNKRAQLIEDYAANSPMTADMIFENNKNRVDKIVNKFTQTLQGVSGKKTSDLSAGQAVEKAYGDVIGSIRNARRNQASVDFGVADQLSGGQAIVPVNNFSNVLQKFIEEASGELATPAQKKAAAEASKILENLTGEQGAVKSITIKDLQNGLAAFGDASKSTGGIWKDIATAGDRRFASSAKTALESDMDDAIKAANGNPQALEALRVARDRYRDYSNQLNKVNSTVLGRYLGNATERSPERIAEQLTNLRPSEITQTLNVLDQSSPETGNMVRRYMLERAYAKAITQKGQKGAGLEDYKFNVADFLGALPEDARLSAILGDNKKAAKEIKTIAEGLNRIQYMGAQRGGSPTAARTEAKEFLSGSIVSPKFWLGKTLQVMTGRELANIMIDPSKRAIFAKQVKAPDKNAGAIVRMLTNAKSAISKEEGGNQLPSAAKVEAENIAENGLLKEADSADAVARNMEQPFTPEEIIAATAQEQGIDPAFLRIMGETESSLNPNAKASTSSASGLFQFTKGTWKDMVDKYGEKHGVTLADINDPRANTIMAAELTKENYGILAQALNREPTKGELYAAHFLGPEDAMKLIEAKRSRTPVTKILSRRVIDPNRKIFFDGNRARSANEVFQILARKVNKRPKRPSKKDEND